MIPACQMPRLLAAALLTVAPAAAQTGNARPQPAATPSALLVEYGSVSDYAAVLVDATVPLNIAVQWLATAESLENTDDNKSFGPAPRARGLLSYSTTTRRNDKTAVFQRNAVYCEYWRPGSGRDVGVVVVGDTPDERVSAWLDSLIQLKEAERIVALVRENHQGGLVRATQVASLPRLLRVQATWGIVGTA